MTCYTIRIATKQELRISTAMKSRQSATATIGYANANVKRVTWLTGILLLNTITHEEVTISVKELENVFGMACIEKVRRIYSL